MGFFVSTSPKPILKHDQLLTHPHLQRKTKDIITLFHKASSPGSKRVAALLKQVQVEAAEKDLRPEFDLEVTEQPPTLDQVKTILDYVGQPGISSVIKGATSENEALQKFKQSADSFQKPLVCLPCTYINGGMLIC